MTLPTEVNLLLAGNQGYRISRSVRLRSSATAYLTRSPSVAGNRRTWTYSFWVKRGLLNTNQSILSVGQASVADDRIDFTSGNALYIVFNNGATAYPLTTTPLYRDPSAYYHVCISVDTTQAVAANRTIIYVNGVSQLYTGTNVPQNYTFTGFNTTKAHNIGRYYSASQYFDGYLTEINFIDGQALTPSSFGEIDAITGVWQPKEYTGTYGTNGFYLNFSDNSAATAATIGKDYSGNNNNWTPNNISVTAGVTYDSMIDTPTPYADGGNGRGNYPTLNPLQAIGYTPYSNGNLKFTSPVSGLFVSTLTNIAGKWYFELTAESIATPVSFRFGAGNINYFANGDIVVGVTTVATVASYTNGDLIGAAIDRVSATNTMSFYKNGTLQGTYTINTTPNFGVQINAAAPDSASFNFGQRPFSYTPPTGFKALNTQNLPASTIENGATQFDVQTWAGNGVAGYQSATANFAIGFAWIKNRSGAFNHVLTDSVRGNNLSLASNSTAAEYSSSGVLLGTGVNQGKVYTNPISELNSSGSSYVNWVWKAGGAAVTNTAGSISSQVSANVSAGFSVVTYTGTGANATVGHGLGVAPKMMIVKGRSAVSSWGVWHEALSATEYLLLESTSAKATLAAVWNSTLPTSSVFSVGADLTTNGNGRTLVAYLFAEVAGYSAFGSYTGNGSTDGTFVYLGFRPRYVMVKASGIVADWLVYDTARDTYNVMNAELFPNTSGAEQTVSTNDFDFLSNGFKCRRGGTISNQNGATYIYMAFAENPFSKALAR